MIKINKEKLEQVILNEMADIENGPFLGGECFIYQDKSIQVSIVVTKDKEEFCDEVSPTYICIVDSK